MEHTYESYEITLVDNVNDVELMFSDKKEKLSGNIKVYIIQQGDITIINIVNKDNKSIRLQLSDKVRYIYKYRKVFFKDYIYISLYDKTHRNVYSQYINATDMNYKTRLFTIIDCIINILKELSHSIILTPSFLYLIFAIFFVKWFSDDIKLFIEGVLEYIK